MSGSPLVYIFLISIFIFGCLCFWCDAFDVIFLLNQAWVPSLMGSKVHILTLGLWWSESVVFTAGTKKGVQAANLQKTWQWPQCFWLWDVSGNRTLCDDVRPFFPSIGFGFVMEHRWWSSLCTQVGHLALFWWGIGWKARELDPDRWFCIALVCFFDIPDKDGLWIIKYGWSELCFTM